MHDGRLDPGVQLISKPFAYSALAARIRDLLDAAPTPARILVVEDEALIQMLAAENLAVLGYKVETASSATETRNKLRLLNGEVDAAIVDLGLPDAKGDALVSELRSLYPALPIVIASGQDGVELQRKFPGQKFIGFLSKPYTVEQMRAAPGVIGALD